MGAKKKNKGNKLARMSEEERMRYLQHRAAIEEERKRRKEQLISTFLKNKLKREQIFSRLNVAKINQQWRQILRQIKCLELKQEIEDLRGWFDYTLTKKNRMIKTVLIDLDDAENQYTKMHWSQMEAFDKLLKIHHQRIDYYYVQYKQNRNDRYGKAIGDIKDIKESYRTDEEQLQAALYRSEESFAQKIASITSLHLSKTDELRNNMLTDLENVRNSRESRIEELWQDFETTLRLYWEQTEDRRRQYLRMRDVDCENCRQIFENNQQINSVIDVIEGLKNQLSKSHATGLQLISSQKANRENSRKFFYRLKREVINETEADKQILNFMNCTAGKTTDALKATLDRGQQILKLHGLCTNLETENEQIFRDLVWEKPQLTEDEEKEVEEQMKKYVEPLTERFSSDVMKLDGFWKRYNRVLLERESLALHYRALTNEKKYLENILRNYFSAYAVKQPESKLSYANGLQFGQRRPSTSWLPERPSKTRFGLTCCGEVRQTPAVKKIVSAQTRKSSATGKYNIETFLVPRSEK